MRLLRSSRYRAALAGAAMALGLITALAVAGAPATAATSSSSHISSTATQETLISSSAPALAVAKAASAGYQGKTLISSPWGLHTAGIIARTCSSSTAHWFTLHINYDAGPYGWFYQCFGYQGTVYFPSNVFAWACAGNNHGTFSYYPISGGTDTFKFGAGWSSNFNSLDDVNYLTINGWSGSYNCP